MPKKTMNEFVEETKAAEEAKLKAAEVESPETSTTPTPEASTTTTNEATPTDPTPQAKVEASTPAPEQPENKPFDFAEWVREMPKEAKTSIEQAMQYQLDSYIQNTFGPELTQLAAEIAADPGLKKDLAKLSNKELRQFLFEYGVDAFESLPKNEAAQPATIPREVKDLQEKLEAIEKRDTERTRQEEWQRYLAYRDNELNALRREYPELDNQDLANFVVKTAHERTQLQQARGINQPYSIRDVYLETKKIQSKQPKAPSIPATSSNSGPQAPTDQVEVKNKLMKDLKGRSLQEFINLGKTYN